MNKDLFNQEIEASGYPMTVIAERTGIPYRHLLAIKYGEVKCTIEDARKISEFLNWNAQKKHAIFF